MHPAVGKYVLRNQIEDTLCDREGEWSPLVDRILKICRAESNRNALVCSTKEKRMLAEFVANLILRNPWTIQFARLDEIEEAKELKETKQISDLLDQLGIGKIDSTLEFINKSNYFNNEYGDQKLLADELFEMKMSFIYNEKNDFLTSSYPVFCGVRNGEEKTVEVLFPLAPDVMVLYGFEDAKKVRRNRVGYNSNLSIGLKYLYASAYSSSKARFLIGRRKEDFVDVENPELLLHSFKKLCFQS